MIQVQGRVTNLSISGRGASKMGELEMTDYQFQTLIQMITLIIEKSDNLEDAVQKIKALNPKEIAT